MNDHIFRYASLGLKKEMDASKCELIYTARPVVRKLINNTGSALPTCNYTHSSLPMWYFLSNDSLKI